MKIDRTDEKEMIEKRKAKLKETIEYVTPITCRHFKGDFYEILGTGIHTETREEFVVYRRKYVEPFNVWIRPIDMFLSYIEEKDEDNYPDTLYRVALYSELKATEEQVELALKMKDRIEKDKVKYYAKSLRGEIVRITNIVITNTDSYAIIVRGHNILTPNQSPKQLIPVAELLTDNFEIIEEGDLTVDGLIQASQLSEQIHRTNGGF